MQLMQLIATSDSFSVASLLCPELTQQEWGHLSDLRSGPVSIVALMQLMQLIATSDSFSVASLLCPGLTQQEWVRSEGYIRFRKKGIVWK